MKDREGVSDEIDLWWLQYYDGTMALPFAAVWVDSADQLYVEPIRDLRTTAPEEVAAMVLGIVEQLVADSREIGGRSALAPLLDQLSNTLQVTQSQRVPSGEVAALIAQNRIRALTAGG